MSVPNRNKQRKTRRRKAGEAAAPLTFADAARQLNWGAGDKALNPDPNTDRYFITTTGTTGTTDPNWTPGPEDWERLAEMFRA